MKKEGLIQKQGIMVMTLAKDFLDKEVGDRIDTVASMAEKYAMARGTIQTALKTLVDNNAIILEPRGHLGTFIRFIDYNELLKFSGIDNIVCVMPLPYTKRYEGIATGLYNVINRKNISFSLAFMRGSDNRLKFLKEGRYDLALTSKLTANYYMNNNENVDIVAAFGEHTYVKGHALIVRKNYKGYFSGMRVGVDESSYDQVSLTNEYFNDKNVQFIKVQYNYLIEHLLNNEIDATIWSEDETIYEGKELKSIPLKELKTNTLDTEAVIIANKDNETIINLVKRLIDIENVLDIQKKVLSNKLVPNY